MMQWLGNSSSHFIFNDRGKGCLSNGSTAPPPDDDTLCAVVCDMAQGRRAVVLPMPIYSVSFDGEWGRAGGGRVKWQSPGTGPDTCHTTGCPTAYCKLM